MLPFKFNFTTNRNQNKIYLFTKSIQSKPFKQLPTKHRIKFQLYAKTRVETPSATQLTQKPKYTNKIIEFTDDGCIFLKLYIGCKPTFHIYNNTYTQVYSSFTS